MDQLIVAVVDSVVVPVTGTIPFLASSGILLLVFAALWVTFGVALIRDRARLDAAWMRVRRWPLPVQTLAWLLFLPPMAGLWAWRRGWSVVVRISVIAGIAGWNLLVFLPTGRVG